jgi:hypothetical protein
VVSSAGEQHTPVINTSFAYERQLDPISRIVLGHPKEASIEHRRRTSSVAATFLFAEVADVCASLDSGGIVQREVVGAAAREREQH